MIRLAKKEEIGEILKITKACAEHLISQNIFQWNESYPSKEAFENDMKRKELYVFSEKDDIIGCITISPKIDKEYLSINWLTPNKNNLYVHRLAVHPKYQGEGFAQELMNFTENFAIKNKFKSIRLDTFSKNTRNQKFYELRGYQKLGNCYFPNQSEEPFYCYEMILIN